MATVSFLGAARFQGFWNASTNAGTGSGDDGAAPGTAYTTLLVNGGYGGTTGLTASNGDYWQVTGSGTTTINGMSSWALNDWCIYSGSVWQKLSFDDTIASIVLGDLSTSTFHMGTANDKHIIFNSGSQHTGSSNFLFDYTNNRVGIGRDTPRVTLDVVYDYSATTFENQLSDGQGGGKILRYSPASSATLTAGSLYYLATGSAGSGGHWNMTKATVLESGSSGLLGVGLGGNPKTVGVLLEGFVRVPSTLINGTFVTGAAVYVSEEAGHWDFTAPSQSREFVRVMGYALDRHTNDALVYFNPDSTWVEIA